MDKNGVLGEILEKGQSVVQKTGKTVADSATGAAKTVAGQVTGDFNQSGTSESNVPASDKQQSVSDQSKNDEFVKELYAPSKAKDNQNAKIGPQSQNAEQAKLAGVRQKLHDEVYYQPLVNPPKSQEERPAEKVEREKMEDLQEQQDKKEKQKPIAVSNAQTTVEVNRGVSG